MIDDLLSVKEAPKWASDYLGTDITPSKISYLVQYAKIGKYTTSSKVVKVKRVNWNNITIKKGIRRRVGKINSVKTSIGRSVDQYSEFETTKHVHRLHPYKGKFIPQLVQYFLDDHINKYKKEVFFKEGDVVLVLSWGVEQHLFRLQEFGINSIGIDISEFNCLIAKVKSDNYSLPDIDGKLIRAFRKTVEFSNETFDNNYEIE